MSRNCCMYWAVSFLCISFQQWFSLRFYDICYSVRARMHMCSDMLVWHDPCEEVRTTLWFISPFLPLFPGFWELSLRLSGLRRSSLCCLFSVKLLQAFSSLKGALIENNCSHLIVQWVCRWLNVTINDECRGPNSAGAIPRSLSWVL